MNTKPQQFYTKNSFIVEEPATKPDKTEGPCKGRYPATCDFNSGCPYSAEWTFDPVADTIRFKVMAKQDPTQKWIGIGFSSDRKMVHSLIFIT